MPWAIFLLVAAVTLLSIFAIEYGQNQRDRAELSSRAIEVASALERRANASSAYLHAGAALLASLDDVPASRFRRFVSELRLEADYRGAEGIGWAEVVQPQEVGQFNAMMAEMGPGDPQLHPPLAPGQPFAVPVTFLQPDTERNRRALGFDMFSEEVRREAMLECVESPETFETVPLPEPGGDVALPNCRGPGTLPSRFGPQPDARPGHHHADVTTAQTAVDRLLDYPHGAALVHFFAIHGRPLHFFLPSRRAVRWASTSSSLILAGTGA